MSESQPINPGPPDRELFLAVLEVPADQREAFLAAQCGNDAARRQRVAALLAEHQTESSFLDSPAVARSAGGTRVMATTLTQNDIPPGERIGRYKLLQQIGEGGCGVVYMAEQEEPVRRRVALKIIKLGMDTKGVIARFEAERQALAMMDHPNIAKVLDAGATETGRPYFVMELVRGIKITEYADQSNLSTEDRLQLFIQVCNAIQHAHQKGIIHRDIKPSNILVTLHDGVPVPKVIDFGIAKAIEQKLTDKTLFTQFQAFIGTPAYMSPEQAEMSGLDIDTRSDIYSLGVLLYEILTGETPFDPQALISKGIDECRRTIREQEPARPSNRLATMLVADLTTTAQHRRIEAARLINLLQGDLDWIVMKCLEKDRSRRYDTAVGLAADVQRYLNSEAVLARPPSRLYRLRKFLHKNRAPVAAAASIAILLVVGSTVSFWLAIRAGKAEDEAKQLAETAQKEATRAQLGERAALQNMYVVDISLAQQSLKDGNLAKAVQLLEKHLPLAGEPDLRGFEWRYLWEQSRGDEHLDLPPQDGSVQALAVSPDGTLLAVAVRDRLQIWDPRTRTRVVTLTAGEFAPEGPAGPRGPGGPGGSRGGWGGGFRFAGFPSLAFLADGSALVAASADKVRIWNTTDWSERPPVANHAGSIAVAPARSLVAATKAGFMRREGLTLFAPEIPWRKVGELEEAGRPFAFSPDGSKLASGSPTGLAVWSLDGNGKASLTLENSTNVVNEGGWGWNTERLIAWSPDGSFIVAARNQPSDRGVFVLNLWDARTGADLGTIPESADQIEHTGVITALAFSPRGDLLASASLDHSVRLWRLADRRRIATLQGHLNEVWTLAFSPDGRTLYTGAKDGSVKIWSTTRTERADHLATVASPLGFSRDSQTLATLTHDRTVAFINLATGEKVREFGQPARNKREGPDFNRPPANSFALSADLRLLAQGARDGTVQIWNTETGETNSVKILSRDIESLVLSPDGGLLGARSRGPMSGWVWHDLRAGTNLSWQLEAERLTFSPDGRWLATTHRGEPPKLWSLTDRALRSTLEISDGQALFGPSVPAFSPDGSRLALAYGDHTIGIWDTENGKLLGFCTGHKQPAFALAFSADGATLASAGADSTLRMWNVATLQELLVDRRLGFNLRNLLFSPDGQWLVGASGNPQQEITRLFKAPVVSDAEVISRLASKRAQIN